MVITIAPSALGETIELRAKDTLWTVEMDHGDALRFPLQNGRCCVFELVGTDAPIVERVPPGGIVYRFWARFRVEGQPLTMPRNVCSQE